MSSTIATLSLSGFDALAALYSASIESGEFIVIVAAVDSASHDGRPSFCVVASRSIFLYTASICRGAGIGPGRAWEAFMRALRLGDSLDIVVSLQSRLVDWQRSLVGYVTAKLLSNDDTSTSKTGTREEMTKENVECMYNESTNDQNAPSRSTIQSSVVK